MADSQRIFDPGARFIDANGDPLDGGTLYFYDAGTSTPRTVYTDKDLLTVLGSSCVLDSGGYPTTDGNTKTLIHTGTTDYKVILKDGDGNTIATHDNIKGALDTSSFSTTYAIGTSPVVSKTAAYTILTSDKGKHFACDPTGGAFALTLPSAVLAGDGFIVYVSHNADSSNPVSVLPAGNSSVGGKSAYTVGRRESAMFVCDGANWRVSSDRKPFFSGLIRITDRLTAPPSSPTAGARYIINGTPTGAWSTLSFAQHDIAESDGNGSWFRWTPLDGWMAYVQDENLVTVFVDTAWTDWTNVTAPTTSYLGVANFEAQYASGTAGSSAATAGSWTKATINTEVYNTITSAALASSVVTLPAGRYTFDANVYLSISGLAATQQFGLRLRDTTAGANLGFVAESVAGAEINTNNAVAPSKRVRLRGVFTLSTTTTIELQYNITVSSGTVNIGAPGSFSVNESYAQMMFMSLAALQGPAGSQGTQGTDGLDASYAYTWSTSTSGDPGSGKIAGNNATIASITQLAISETDANGASLGSAVLGSWDDSTSSNKARVIIQKEGATQNRHEFLINGTGTDQGAYWTFPVSYVSTGGTISNGNSVAVNVVEKGDKGDTGAAGATGTTGATGSTSFNFSTTTEDADPGSGIFRLNNATASSATAIYVDNNNSGGSDVSGWLDTIDDGGNSSFRGQLFIFDALSPKTVYRIYNVTGSVVNGTGYRKLTVAHVNGAGSFTNGNEIVWAFFPAGKQIDETIIIAVSDETTAITTGTAKVTFRMPFAMTLSGVRASLGTASSSGNPAIDINEGGVSIFSTTLTIDANEKTSTTAATAAVLSDTALADDAEITIDIDTAGTGAKGLKVALIGTRA